MSDKKDYTVSRPISFCGGRVETGSVVPLTDEEAAAWGPEFVQLAGEPVVLPEQPAAPSDAGDGSEDKGTGEYAPDEKSPEETPAVDAPATTEEAPAPAEVPAEVPADAPAAAPEGEEAAV